MLLDQSGIQEVIQEAMKSPVWAERGYQLVMEALIYEKYWDAGAKKGKGDWNTRKREQGCLQNVPTPFSLCSRVLSKLNEHTRLETKSCVAVLFNLEFVDVLIREFGVSADKITFYPDSEFEALLARVWYGVNVEDRIRGNLVMSEVRKKFDVVIMNPPYQPPIKGFGKSGGSAKTIYDKFVAKALDILSIDGHLCAVHPNRWRRPEDKLWPRMKSKHIKYVEIHDKKDGKKTFGAATRYDWYVLQNTDNSDKMVDILDEQGEKHKIDLSDWPFMPNSHFERVKSILLKPGEKPCKILYSYTAYPTNIAQSWMSKEKTTTHCNPVIAGTGKKGTKIVWTSRKEEFFGVPKVIFGDGDRIHNAILDFDGEYGITPHSMAIPVSSRKEGEQVKKALESAEFNKVVKACKWSSFQIDYRMFEYFREDFWREFL